MILKDVSDVSALWFYRLYLPEIKYGISAYGTGSNPPELKG